MRNQIIRELRENGGFSRRQVAQAIGITEHTLYLIETDPDKEFVASTVVKLADFYGVTTDYILGRNGNRGSK